MRRVAFVLTVFIVWWAQLPLHAENELQNVVITEVMTASIESAAAEFIELYNPNDISVQLTDWRVEYKSANGQNWHTKYTFEEFEAQPRGFILLATEELGLDENEVDGTFSGGLALAVGHIRIQKKHAESPALDE